MATRCFKGAMTWMLLLNLVLCLSAMAAHVNHKEEDQVKRKGNLKISQPYFKGLIHQEMRDIQNGDIWNMAAPGDVLTAQNGHVDHNEPDPNIDTSMHRISWSGIGGLFDQQRQYLKEIKAKSNWPINKDADNAKSPLRSTKQIWNMVLKPKDMESYYHVLIANKPGSLPISSAMVKDFWEENIPQPPLGKDTEFLVESIFDTRQPAVRSQEVNTAKDRNHEPDTIETVGLASKGSLNFGAFNHHVLRATPNLISTINNLDKTPNISPNKELNARTLQLMERIKDGGKPYGNGVIHGSSREKNTIFDYLHKYRRLSPWDLSETKSAWGRDTKNNIDQKDLLLPGTSSSNSGSHYNNPLNIDRILDAVRYPEDMSKVKSAHKINGERYDPSSYLNKNHGRTSAHKRFRRDEDEALRTGTGFPKDEKEAEPPVNDKTVNDTDISEPLNISDSSLYRAGGQMGYVDTSGQSGGHLNTNPGNLNDDITEHLPSSPDTMEYALNASVSQLNIANVSDSEDPSYVDPEPEPEAENTTSGANPESETKLIPETESESESQSQSDGEGEPDSENGKETMNKTDSELHGCDNGICYAEPYPDWDEAKPKYGGAWEFHVYGIGIAFAILSIYSLVCMIMLRQKKNLLSRGYFMSLNGSLVLVGVTRAVYLLVDGYDSFRIFHPVISYMLFNTIFPCLTSAFSILFLAMLRATKMQLLSKKIQHPRVLVGIIVFHFLITLSVDLTVGFVYSMRALFLVCQVLFIVWGVTLFCSYFYLFWKLYHSSAMDYTTRESINLANRSVRGVAPAGRESGDENDPKMSKWTFFKKKVMLHVALKVTLGTAFLGVAHIIVVIYGMIDVFNVFAKDRPQAWPFWAYHFCIRLIELAMCGTMSFVATQPLRLQRPRASGVNEEPSSDCRNFMYFFPCYRFCGEVGEESNNSFSGRKYLADESSHSHSDSYTAKDDSTRSPHEK